MPAADRSHYRGAYKVRAPLVTAAAYANPATRCWRCRRTLAEVQAAYPKRRVRWHAGHTVAGDPHCALLAECSVCNGRDGQRLSMTGRRSSGGTGRI